MRGSGAVPLVEDMSRTKEAADCFLLMAKKEEEEESGRVYVGEGLEKKRRVVLVAAAAVAERAVYVCVGKRKG